MSLSRHRKRTASTLLAAGAAVALLGAGGSGNELSLFSGVATVTEGDEYSKIFIGGAAEVFMNGGIIHGESIAASGGTIYLSGGEIGLDAYLISNPTTTIPSRMEITGGLIGARDGVNPGAIFIGGLGELVVEAERFFHDADGDGASDEPLPMNGEGELVIDSGSELFQSDGDGRRSIPGVRWIFADGAEQRVTLIEFNSVDGDWTGAITLRATLSPADLNGDGVVGSGDLAILLAAWGGPDADLTGDGVVGSGDLAVLLAAWGD